MTRQDARIPVELISPIVKEYLDNYETYKVTNKYRQITGNSWTSPAGGSTYRNPTAVLAEKMGVDAGVITAILKHKYKNMEFNKVDKLFCAMDVPLRFWLDGGALQEAYYAADIADDAARSTLTVLPDGRKICANPECREPFHLGTQLSKIYCTKKCKEQVRYLKRRKDAKA